MEDRSGAITSAKRHGSGFLGTVRDPRSRPGEYRKPRASKTGAIPKVRPGGGPQPVRAGTTPGPVRTVKIDGAKKFSGSQQVPPLMQSGSASHGCVNCGKTYTSRANLARHEKDCGKRDKQKCLFFPFSASTFAGVRQHERRAHPLEYAADLEGKVGAPESQIMAKLASIEARCKGSVVSIKELTKATGLTIHQVRSRREKPLYKKYLERERRCLREGGIGTLFPTGAPQPQPSASSPRPSLTTAKDAKLSPIIEMPLPKRDTAIVTAPPHLPQAALPSKRLSDVPTPGKRRPSSSPQLPHPAKVKRGIACATKPPTTSRADPIVTASPDLTIPPTPPRPPSTPVLTPVPKTPSPSSTIPSINLVTPPPTDTTHFSQGSTTQPKRKREMDSFSPQPSNIRKRTVTFHESPPKPEEVVRDLPAEPPPRRSLSASDISALREPLLDIPTELLELPFLDHLLQSRNGADDHTKALISAGRANDAGRSAARPAKRRGLLRRTDVTVAKDIEVEEEAATALPGPTIELVEESILQPNSSCLEAAIPAVSGPAEVTPCSTSAPGPSAESPLAAVRRGSLVESPAVNTCPIDVVATPDPVRQYLASYFELTEGWSDEDRTLYDLSVKNSKDKVLKGLEKWLKHMLATLNVRINSSEARGNNGRYYKKSRGKGSYRRDANRAHLYKIAPIIYKRNRTRLAEHILDDKPLDSAQVYPPIENIQARYNEILATESPEDNHPILDFINHSIETYLPVTEPEIVRGLAEMKSPAAGPDHLRPAHLRRLHPRCLVLVFNIMVISDMVPETLKENRTVLLHKGGDPLLSPYHDIFRPAPTVDEVLLNTLTLQAVLKQRRAQRRPVSVVALDTDSQNSIIRARFQVDDCTIRFIGEQYRETFTKVSGGGSTTVAINTGAKQGDPLSPVLLSMVLDELIVKLEGMSGGVSVGDGPRLCRRSDSLCQRSQGR
ncbi:hypothetical protein Trydic_g15645 [Trypoxylus dichotomus]